MALKTKKNIMTVYTVLAILAGLGLSVYRTILLKQHYDPYDASFEHGSREVFSVFEYMLLAVSLICLTAVFFAMGSKFQLFSARSSTTSISICAVCGVVPLAIVIFVLAFHHGEIFNFRSNGAIYRVLFISAIFLMLISSLYFLGCASTALAKSRAKASLSLALPLFGLTYLTATYLNEDLIFYDSNRITCILASIFIMLFFLAESKVATSGAGYAFHFAASLACIVAVSAYIIPILVLVAFWEISMSLPTVTELSFIGILIYAVFSAVNSIRTLEEGEKSSAAEA